MAFSIREIVFWLVDFFTGSKIRKEYKDISNKLNCAIDHNREQEILFYAKKHVPFYKNIKGDRLIDFPIMNKSIYKSQGVKCISDEYPDYLRLYKASTSGSTGTPMVVYEDPREKIDQGLI